MMRTARNLLAEEYATQELAIKSFTEFDLLARKTLNTNNVLNSQVKSVNVKQNTPNLVISNDNEKYDPLITNNLLRDLNP